MFYATPHLGETKWEGRRDRPTFISYIGLYELILKANFCEDYY